MLNGWVSLLQDVQEGIMEGRQFGWNLPKSLAGRIELIQSWLVGVPITWECPCGCCEVVETGRSL